MSLFNNRICGVALLCLSEISTLLGGSVLSDHPTQMLNLPSGDAGSHANSRASEIETFWQAGQKAQAREKIAEWMKEEKNSPWPWVASSRLHFYDSRFQRSISHGQVAIQKSPDCGEAYYWRGRSFEALKKPLDAANEYRAALLAKNSYSAAQADLDRVQGLLGHRSEVSKESVSTNNSVP